MKQREQLEQLKETYQSMKAPQEGLELMYDTIEKAKADKNTARKRKRTYTWGAVASALFMVVILPNANQTLANTLSNLPVIGNVFEVVTVRNYHYNKSDGTQEMDAKVPQIEETGSDVAAKKEINQDAEQFVDTLVKKFQRDMKKSGYVGLNVSYKVVTNDENWFTLRFDVLETQASGDEFSRFYHIDKRTGKTATLQDIFVENADYVDIITKEIVRQMKAQMQSGEADYFLVGNGITEGFEKISKTQNFYFDPKGALVIAFDEYEVGPGYIGAPEFTIPNKVIADIIKYK